LEKRETERDAVRDENGERPIAEFVEDAETLEMLRSIGVDCAQGFHIGRPTPLDEVLAGIPRSS